MEIDDLQAVIDHGHRIIEQGYGRLIVAQELIEHDRQLRIMSREAISASRERMRRITDQNSN